MSITLQIWYLLSWLILLGLLQIAIEPWFRRIGKEVSAPISWIVSLLLTALISWYLALLRLPPQLTLIFFIILLGFNIYKRSYNTQTIRRIVNSYGLFLLVFLISLGIKVVLTPNIDFLFERYMDAMILSSVSYSPMVPPIDGWFAGGTLAMYYYMSGWLFAILGLLSGVPSWVVYNLAVPTVFGVTGVLIGAITSFLPGKFRFLPFLILFISYPAFIVFLIPIALSRVPLLIVFEKTLRIIPGAITENPLTAIFIGSPRPYAVSLMIQIFLIYILIIVWKYWREMNIAQRLNITAIMILGLGTMVPLHTWDAVIYTPIILIVGLLISWRSLDISLQKDQGISKQIRFWIKTGFKSLKTKTSLLTSPITSAVFLISILVPIGSALLYLPFLMMMENKRMQGFTFYPNPTDLVPFLLVHGFFLLLLIVWVFPDIRKRPYLLIISLIPAFFGYASVAIASIPLIYLVSRRFSRIEELFAAAGICCIIFCDFFAILDNGTADRMNTTYKFYFAFWILAGLTSLQFLREMLSDWKFAQPNLTYKALSGVLICIGVFFPAVLLSSGPLGVMTIDGSEYLSYMYPDEYQMIDFLRTLPGKDLLVEGIYTDYQEADDSRYLSRVSTMTGIPAVVGSYFREEIYRGKDSVKNRGEDIITIYKDPSQAADLMQKYNATLLIVGEPETILSEMQDPEIFAKYGFVPIFKNTRCTVWRPPYYSD